MDLLPIAEENKGGGSADLEGSHKVAGALIAVTKDLTKDCISVVCGKFHVLRAESLYKQSRKDVIVGSITAKEVFRSTAL